MSWTVKNVKSWNGQEGRGTTCTLYRDGKKVADCRDDATGGAWNFDFDDYKAPRVAINLIVSDYDADKGEDGNRPDKAHSYKGTPEEKLLAEFANAQAYVSEFGSHKMNMRKDMDTVVSDLCDEVDKQKAAKARQKALKTKTLFVLTKNGSEVEYSITAPYTPELKARLEAEHGDKLVRIVNTEFVDAGEADAIREKKELASIKRKCKNSTVYRLKTDDKGRFWICKRAFSPALAVQLRAKFGDKLEVIYNELLAA